MEPLQSTLLAHLSQVPDFRKCPRAALRLVRTCWRWW